jgi:dUTP pyrophosphatase
MSAYSKRWQESFKKRRCPHGNRIYSPEDECLAYRAECSTDIPAVNYVHFVRAKTHEPDPPRQSEEPQVYVQPLNSKVGIPQLPHEGDAAFDLRSTKNIKLSPGEESLLPTGLMMEIPHGYCGKIESKSGLALTGLIVKAGVIDSSFRGEIMVLVANQSFQDYHIMERDKITQIMFLPVLTKPLIHVKKLPSTTTRGNRGFGSTGVHHIQTPKQLMKLNHPNITGDKHTYHLGEQLTDQQKGRICFIMESYADVLAVSFEELRHAKVKYHHHVDTGDAEPIKQAPYHLPPHYKQWVREEVNELLKCGIIHPSKSP